tara:strand:+ start:539 stop:1066 length:528 start_codon:yes stop_codon:yes gene_type:complete
MTLENIHALRMSAIDQVEEVAQKAMGMDVVLTTRDLQPADLGYTNQEFTETSGSDNTWADTTISSKSIADETFVAIFGIQMLVPGAISTVITGLRFVIGGGRVAQLSLYGIQQNHTPDDTEATLHRPVSGYLLSPIILTQNSVLTIQEYTVTATTAYTPVFEGVVVEREGKLISP